MTNSNDDGDEGGGLLAAILIGLGVAALGYLVYRALGGGNYECPQCGGVVRYDTQICPHCSSRLRWR